MNSDTPLLSILALAGTAFAAPVPLVTGTSGTLADHMALQSYQDELTSFRAEYGGARRMPAVPFFQFGMGNRSKYLFKRGSLHKAISGEEVLNSGAPASIIIPSEYTVVLTNTQGSRLRIFEDESAVWVEQNGARRPLEGTEQPVRLPRFAEHRYAAILRVLHHEVLMNVVNGRPVPNFYVYAKPWFRDGAMMAMCLKETGNLDLIRSWIAGLNEVYDRNNAGEMEADNPGQVLYLISLVCDRNHPLVPEVLKELQRLEVRDHNGLYIRGRSDFAEHPVYQTKWAKFGLRALGLPDPYTIPAVKDSYSSLFWMDFRQEHGVGAEAADRGLYPYLGWATDHFHGKKLSPISDQDYPLTWEIKASQANYEGMRRIDTRFTDEKTATPHTWHAAEVFLYVLPTK